MTNRTDRARIRTQAESRGWTLIAGTPPADVDRFTRGAADHVVVSFTVSGRILGGRNADVAIATATHGAAHVRDTVIEWLTDPWLREQVAADRARSAPGVTARLIETEHPDTARTSGIAMVHRVYAIDSEASLLVDLPDLGSGGGRYRITTVRTVTQANPSSSYRSRSTWVNLARQTKSGRDYARGGFASVTLDRLISELDQATGLAVRAALEAVAQPVAVTIGQVLPGDIIGYRVANPERMRVEASHIVGRGPGVGTVADLRVVARDLDGVGSRMIVELPTCPMTRWEW
jgi:hypothetical protein